MKDRRLQSFLSFFVVEKNESKTRIRQHLQSQIAMMREDEGGGENGRAAVMILYLDAFVLINILMNLLLLDLTKHFLKLYAGKKRLWLAAFSGGTINCVLVVAFRLWEFAAWGSGVEVLREISEIAIEGPAVSALMLWVAFGRVPVQEFAHRFVTLYLMGALMGGTLELLGVHIPREWGLTISGCCRQWKLLPVILWGIVIYSGLLFLWRHLGRREEHREIFFRVTLCYRGKTETVTALCDTGNRLFEPYHHHPVHIVSEVVGRRLIDRVNQVIYVPFRSIGVRYGVLPCVRIDHMQVETEEGTVRQYDHPWIAISRYPLSRGHGYEMLLHTEES
ncbi:MAG: sigma-E processing peptidase SpoIIGA [Clostridiales bacterium]|nr:sigma-E processing peptidase SpoIIGA [Clostridiales bacterium]